MRRSTSVLTAGCAAAAVLALAPAAHASGKGSGGGPAGGGATPACQITQLSDTPVLLTSLSAIDTTFALSGCAGSSWGLTYVNTARATTDFVAGGAAGAVAQTVEAGPLPYNYPYAVTLTVTSPAGAVVASRSATLFTPKPRD